MNEAEFQMTARDYGLSVEVTCTNNSGCYPNQRTLRSAINDLLFELANWEHVDVVIKTVSEDEG